MKTFHQNFITFKLFRNISNANFFKIMLTFRYNLVYARQPIKNRQDFLRNRFCDIY